MDSAQTSFPTDTGVVVYHTPIGSVWYPQIDSTFGDYKNLVELFDRYYFSGDTIYLNPKAPEFDAYLVKKDKDKLVFEALNKEETAFMNIYLTRITDFFEKDSVEYKESEVYNLLKSKTWVFEEITYGYKVHKNNASNKYKLKEDVLIVDNGKLHYEGDVMSFLDSTNNFKFTDKGIYIRENDKLMISLKATLRKGHYYDEIILTGNQGVFETVFKLKEVNPKDLVNYDDLPKNIRLKCLESVVRYSLEEYLKEENEFNNFYFDLGTLKFIRSVDEECIYHYAVTQRSRDYYDIYTKMRVKVEVREDGLIYFDFY
ncbi:hypothetical protein NMK71_01635 [Weeksellaceae bacterium KMM 9713]|uniref:Uncharacterized protein n=1 Tax=Profundicola chukchiensis TaxID=2961959 RepID=A0A9X4RTK2_9FLAO|nr:hypothetical protein [Profundicola chukchiensis]MDG4945103.1 hypothetical protein [Profundicola chukchiensis]